MQDERDTERESIWSVRHTSVTPYFIVFGVLFAVMTGLIFWREFTIAPREAHIIDTAIRAWLWSCGSAIGEAILAMYIGEGWNMLAERFLRRRYREGVEKGRVEGRSEGEELANRRWRAWLERREAARDEGREFNEPPPYGPQNGNGT